MSSPPAASPTTAHSTRATRTINFILDAWSLDSLDDIFTTLGSTDSVELARFKPARYSENLVKVIWRLIDQFGFSLDTFRAEAAQELSITTGNPKLRQLSHSHLDHLVKRVAQERGGSDQLRRSRGYTYSTSPGLEEDANSMPHSTAQHEDAAVPNTLVDPALTTRGPSISSTSNRHRRTSNTFSKPISRSRLSSSFQARSPDLSDAANRRSRKRDLRLAELRKDEVEAGSATANYSIELAQEDLVAAREVLKQKLAELEGGPQPSTVQALQRGLAKQFADASRFLTRQTMDGYDALNALLDLEARDAGKEREQLQAQHDAAAMYVKHQEEDLAEYQSRLDGFKKELAELDAQINRFHEKEDTLE